MKRRQFIALTGAATAGTVGAGYLGWHAWRQARQPGATLAQDAARHRSQNGVLDVSLEAQQGQIALAGRQANLMSFNGRVPGPRLEVEPGDTVRIRFANRLDEPTNLHYHGLHVPPSGRADNVFVTVPAGERFDYEFQIPSDHPAGTFWYHPHKHGRVARQVFGGLAGLLVVRGELDRIPEVKAAREQFLVLKDFALDGNGEIQPPGRMERQMRGRKGDLVTVNGEAEPQLTLEQDGLLRLRLLNASAARFYRLQLEGHSMHLIATDAGAIEQPVELSELLLTPGERAEVLVRGDREPGEYRLRNFPEERDRGGMMDGGGMQGMGMMDGGCCGGSDSPQTLARLTYSGRRQAQPLPQKLASVPALPEPQRIRRFELGHGMADGGMAFHINGRTFDAQRLDTQVPLDSIEDWEIANVGMGMMSFDHPFHLHTNPFQVVSRNGQAPAYRAWQDTVLVPEDETIRIRIPFRDFAGKTVYHCHILDHEDLGMMGSVRMNA